ncbi:MAG: flagellar export protein FliJ [Clostridia bacterium]|nr:flagellar export protein FliJ [Clostridia bacterium]
MKKFKFSLDNVLSYRMAVENQEMNRLTQAMLAEREERSRLACFQAELGCQAERFSSQHLEAVRHYESYLGAMVDRIGDQKKAVDRAVERVCVCRGRVVEAKRKREILDKLRERQYAEYLVATRRDEQKACDEAGGHLFVRRARNLLG